MHRLPNEITKIQIRNVPRWLAHAFCILLSWRTQLSRKKYLVKLGILAKNRNPAHPHC